MATPPASVTDLTVLKDLLVEKGYTVDSFTSIDGDTLVVSYQGNRISAIVIAYNKILATRLIPELSAFMQPFSHWLYDFAIEI